ncbi:MAG: hypothetical protein AB1643_01710 [Patescibacteria group bacterium]
MKLMNESWKEKIQEVLLPSRSIALILNENFEEHEFLLREALKTALRSKNYFTYSIPEDDKILSEKWSAIIPRLDNIQPSHTASILIPKDKFNIKEVFYENNDNFFVLNIKTENNKLSPEDIVFRSKPISIDAVLYLGDLETNRLEAPQNKILLPPKEKILSITHQNKTLIENVKEIISIIDGGLLSSNNIATILFAALVLETKNFTSYLSEQTMELAGILLRLGADKKAISEILEKEKTDTFAQLLGRSLARTRINQNLSSAWTFLSKEDFEKTGFDNQDFKLLYKILLKIRDFLPSQSFYFLLWQKNDEVFSLATSEYNTIEILVSLAENLNCDFYGRFFVCGPFKNFSESELKLRELLKEKLK